MNEKEKNTFLESVRNKLELAIQELNMAKKYFDKSDAYEFEHHIWQTKNHIRSLTEWSIEWADAVEQGERLKRENINHS